VIDDLILHVWKGQFDSVLVGLVFRFSVLVLVLNVGVLLTSLLTSAVEVQA